MKITVVAVGKLKERFWADACAEYAKRLSAYATVKMVEIADRDPAKSGGEEAGRALEGKGILAAIPERSHVVLLDIGGKERSSEEIASHLDDLMLRGESSITFVIGGSCGVSPEVRAVPTSGFRSGASRSRTIWPAWSCSSRCTARSRSCAASRITSRACRPFPARGSVWRLREQTGCIEAPRAGITL